MKNKTLFSATFLGFLLAISNAYAVGFQTHFITSSNTQMEPQLHNDFTFFLPAGTASSASNPYLKQGEPIHLGFYEDNKTHECAVYPRANIFISALKEPLACTQKGYFVEIVTELVSNREYYFKFYFYKKTGEDLIELGHSHSPALKPQP